MNIRRSGLLIFSLGLVHGTAQAGPIDLFEWAFNVDGVLYEAQYGDSMPAAGSLDADGLGSLSLSIADEGDHRVIAFFDFELIEEKNLWYNEHAAANGTPGLGQLWEIDEPGHVNDGTYGDIYDHVLAGVLDNNNFNGLSLTDDVSFALGWDFSLAAGESALINWNLSDVLGTSGFYLSHTDDELGEDSDQSMSIYFWSSLTIDDGTTPPPTGVTEPGALWLLGSGLLGLLGWRRFRS